MEKLSLGLVIGATVASPFTRTMSSVSGQLKALGSLASNISTKQVKLNNLARASQDVKVAFSAFTQAKKRADDLRQALEQAGRTGFPEGLRKIRAELQSAEAAVAKTRRALDTKQAALRDVKGAVAAAGMSVQGYKKELKSLSTELDKTIYNQKLLNDVSAARANFGEAVSGLRSTSMRVMAVGAGVVGGLVVPAMNFEDAMLGVAKQVDGARDSGGRLTQTYYEMRREIQLMAREIPMATNEIAALVTQGARMGVQGKENLLVFAQATAKMATAFEMPAEEIGDQMGKVAQLFKIPTREIERLGDSINYLDDNAISKGRDIIEVLQRMGGSAATLGMSAGHASALASTFLSLGESAERAGTASEGMLRQLNIAKMNPKRFQIGAQMIGMTSDQLSKGMANDAQGTILKVLEKIKALPKEAQMEAVTRLFGKDWGGAIAKLANNIDEYKRQIELATGQAGVGSMDREFQSRLQTTSAQWQMFKNQTTELAVNLGSALLPQLNAIAKSVQPVVSAIAEFAEKNQDLIQGIAKMGGGIALAAIFTKLIVVVKTFFGVLSAAAMANPVGILLFALAAGAVLIYSNWERIKDLFSVFKQMFFAFPGDLKDVLLRIGADIAGFFSSVWEKARTAFVTGVSVVSSIILNWSPIGLFYRAFAAVLSWFGVELPAKFTEFGSMLIQGLINGIKAKWESAKKTMVLLASSVQSAFTNPNMIQSPSRLFMQYGGFIVEGLRLGIGRNAAKAVAAAGAMALGVSSAGAGMRADMPVRITAASKAAQTAASAAPVQAGGAQYTINVYQQAGENGEDFARRVVSIIEQHQGRQRRASLGDWHGGI